MLYRYFFMAREQFRDALETLLKTRSPLKRKCLRRPKWKTWCISVWANASVQNVARRWWCGEKAKELDKVRLTGHLTLNCHRPTSHPRDCPPFLVAASDCHGDLFTVNGIERDSLAGYDMMLFGKKLKAMYIIHVWCPISHLFTSVYI